MFRREDPVRPAQANIPGTVSPVIDVQTPRLETGRVTERDVVNIGKSVVIKGDLSGSEDLTIEGQVEGKIELRQNILTIGANGRIKATIFAKAIVIQGEVTGNITASEKVDIRDNGSVSGDISAPRIAIADGAHFRGSIDMQRAGAKPGDAKIIGEAKSIGDTKPAVVPSSPVSTHPTAASASR